MKYIQREKEHDEAMQKVLSEKDTYHAQCIEYKLIAEKEKEENEKFKMEIESLNNELQKKHNMYVDEIVNLEKKIEIVEHTLKVRDAELKKLLDEREKILADREKFQQEIHSQEQKVQLFIYLLISKISQLTQDLNSEKELNNNLKIKLEQALEKLKQMKESQDQYATPIQKLEKVIEQEKV